MPYYRKTALVYAEQATESGTIDTLEGAMSYEAGAYICTNHADGHQWPVKKDIFEATYKQVCPECTSDDIIDAPEAMWICDDCSHTWHDQSTKPQPPVARGEGEDYPAEFKDPANWRQDPDTGAWLPRNVEVPCDEREERG